ncbi:hypothetical protein EWM64_g5265 [Hericium alpestre]|uniref:Alpha/beta hydrolase fold-3 domain-containing protein n=1 Tax=Hericium alpestre TaxID=135208 RepID=A0A4Y9ZXJ5_9AGAM|nr:hypothetical protein EWM64_g5265 [Hericium alpestre]
MSQYSHLSDVDPEFVPIAKVLPPPPDWSKEEAGTMQAYFNEQFLPMVMKHRRPKLPPEWAYRIHDYQIPVEGGEMAIRCLTPTPAGASKAHLFPLLYWVHGGGWMFGNLDNDDFLLRLVCVELRISVVNIEYRLAPQHLFPTGLNDCYEGLKWAASHPEVLSASTEKGFILGGSLRVPITPQH